MKNLEEIIIFDGHQLRKDEHNEERLHIRYKSVITQDLYYMLPEVFLKSYEQLPYTKILGTNKGIYIKRGN